MALARVRHGREEAREPPPLIAGELGGERVDRLDQRGERVAGLALDLGRQAQQRAAAVARVRLARDEPLALQRSVLGAGFGTEFGVEVDYAANARSLGCETWTAETPDALAAALRAAREQPRPALIACSVEPHRMVLGSGAWWDLGVPETSERALRHRAGAAAQRFHG